MSEVVQHLQPSMDRWTVVILNRRGSQIGTWLGVKADTAEGAIRSVFWNNLPKEKRLYVCEAIAYRQDEATVQHLKPVVVLDFENFGTLEASS